MRGSMADHPLMQACDGSAAGAHEQSRNECVHETGERRQEERQPEPEGVALMLQIGLSNGVRMLEEQAGEHCAPYGLTPLPIGQ